MQDYDISVPPNAPRQLDAPGNYVYFYEGTAGGADATLRVRGRSSGLSVQLAPGQAFRLPTGQRETSWILSNKDGGGTILGTVVIGDGEITDNRITGSVEVIDAARSLVLSDLSFWTYGYAAPVAGQFPHSVVINPAASSRTLNVHPTLIYSGSAVQVNLTTGTAAGVLALGGLTAIAPSTRNIGSAGAPQHGVYVFSNLAAQGTATRFPPRITSAGVQLEVPRLRSPFVLKPGTALIAAANVSGADLGVAWDVEEF